MKKGFFTEYEITIDGKLKVKVLSLIIKSSLTYKEAKMSANKEFKIRIKGKDRKIYEGLFQREQVEYKIIEITGIISTVTAIKNRIGIVLGMVFFLSILTFSSNIVWQINVYGNSETTKEEIISELENAGLSLGTFVPSIDYDALHNRILLSSKKLSWISVNITGNVANVYVREREEKIENQTPKYANIVAKYDGYIESISVNKGKKIVSIGQVVRQGDLLVSGIIDSQAEGVRYELADAEIKAYVNKEIFIKIPYKTTKKQYTGKRYIIKDYKIYNFLINFSSKYGNQSSFYDKIEKREIASIFGVVSLPLETITTTFYEYEYVDVVLTKDEAVDKAFLMLREEMDKSLKNAELISKNLKTSFDKSGFYISCQLYCLEDIAKTQEFYVTK